MSTEEMSAIEDVRQRLRDLNEALTKARDLGLTAELHVSSQQVVAARAPIVTVHGRVTRSKMEIDERL